MIAVPAALQPTIAKLEELVSRVELEHSLGSKDVERIRTDMRRLSNQGRMALGAGKGWSTMMEIQTVVGWSRASIKADGQANASRQGGSIDRSRSKRGQHELSSRAETSAAHVPACLN